MCICIMCMSVYMHARTGDMCESECVCVSVSPSSLQSLRFTAVK